MEVSPKSDALFMKKALQLAQQAFDEEEVPIGAVVVCKNQIIGKGYNQVERLKDATAHAEMIAITAACEFLNSKYLKECTLYVTVEPCIMCGGASKWAQLPRIVYGAPDVKMGIFSTNNNQFPYNCEIVEGILANESIALMQQFFKDRR